MRTYWVLFALALTLFLASGCGMLMSLMRFVPPTQNWIVQNAATPAWRGFYAGNWFVLTNLDTSGLHQSPTQKFKIDLILIDSLSAMRRCFALQGELRAGLGDDFSLYYRHSNLSFDFLLEGLPHSLMLTADTRRAWAFFLYGDSQIEQLNIDSLPPARLVLQELPK